MQGRLAPGMLPQLLRDLYVGRRTGLLHISRGDERRSARFRKGSIVRAETNVASERLGETLVRQGELSQEDLDRAAAVMVRDGKKLGAVLQELGIMTRDRLDDALTLHVREMLRSMFASDEGKWAFEELDAETPVEGDISPKLPTGEMILEAVAAIGDPQIVRRELGNQDRVLRPSLDPMLRFQKITLTPADGFLLSRVDGTLTAREVLELAPVEPEEAERSLFGLICCGIVEWGDVAGRPTLIGAPPTPGSETIAPRVKAPAAPPPVAPTPPRTPAPPPRSETPPKPTPAPPTPPPPRPAPPPQAAPASRPAPTAKSAAPDEDLAERRREIESLHARIKTATHFEMLGIPRASSEKEVKAAYFSLARRYHPDTHTDPGIADLEDKIEAIFIRIGEAYDVLRNRDRRAQYESSLPRTRPTPVVQSTEPAAPAPAPEEEKPKLDPMQVAALVSRAFKVAAKLYETEKYFDAIKLLEEHIEMAKGPMRHKMRLLLARNYLKNPRWVKQAEETILDVLNDDPKNVDAYLQLGALYKDKGLRTRSTSMYRKVLELAPHNEIALAEVGPPDEQAADGGLLKRIFRKS